MCKEDGLADGDKGERSTPADYQYLNGHRKWQQNFASYALGGALLHHHLSGTLKQKQVAF